MSKALVYAEVCSDYDDVGALLESFRAALKQFGLELVDDPRYEDSDMIGVLVCNRKPSNRELKEFEEEMS